MLSEGAESFISMVGDSVFEIVVEVFSCRAHLVTLRVFEFVSVVILHHFFELP